MNLYLAAAMVLGFLFKVNPYLIGLIATAALIEMAYRDGVIEKIVTFVKTHVLPETFFQSSESAKPKQSFWDDDDEDF